MEHGRASATTSSARSTGISSDSAVGDEYRQSEHLTIDVSKPRHPPPPPPAHSGGRKQQEGSDARQTSPSSVGESMHTPERKANKSSRDTPTKGARKEVTHLRTIEDSDSESGRETKSDGSAAEASGGNHSDSSGEDQGSLRSGHESADGMTLPTKGNNLLEAEWEDAIIEAERGLYMTPKCHSFRYIIGCTLSIVLLEGGIILVWLVFGQVREIVPWEIFIAALAAAFVFPLVVTIACSWEGAVPTTTLPRALEMAEPEEEDDITGPIRNARFPLLTNVAGVRESQGDHFNITTLRMLWDTAVSRYSGNSCLGVRVVDKQLRRTAVVEGVQEHFEHAGLSSDFIMLSYQDVHNKVRAVGAGFHAKLNHIAAATRELDSRNIGVFTASKIEWIITCLACMWYNMPVISLNPFMSVQQIGNALQSTNAAIIVCDSAAYFSTLAQCIRSIGIKSAGGGSKLNSMGTNLHAVVYVGHEPPPNAIGIFDDVGIEVLSWEALVNLGMRNPVKDEQQAYRVMMEHGKKKSGVFESSDVHELLTVESIQESRKQQQHGVSTVPLPQSVALVNFGGEHDEAESPAMTLHTHENIVSAVGGAIRSLPPLYSNDRYLSCLPPFHLTELCFQLSILFHGGSIGFASCDILSAPYGSSDAPNGRAPGLSLPIPLRDSLSFRPTILNIPPLSLEQIRKGILYYATKRRFPKGLCFRWGLVRKKTAFQQGVGTPFWDSVVFDSIRRNLLGGSLRLLISSGGNLHAVTQRILSTTLCCPVIQVYGNSESSGAIAIQWPDDRQLHRTGPPCACCEIKLRRYGAYQARSAYGEICVRGPNMYNASDDNENEGSRWVSTGDVGRINADGTLTFVGRKQDLIAFPQKLVCARRIENVLLLHELVKNVMVTREASDSSLVAIVSLETSRLKKSSCCFSSQSRKEIMALLYKEFYELVVSHGMEEAKIPTVVVVTEEEWTPANGLLDVYLNLNRRAIFHRYSDEIGKIDGESRSNP
eukprot:gb/GECG01012686.1/.p1 GENE.gb/GECG01012686.1/~~gb/GECG01012686.1/.p1  ORF type:complete len:995 (+),score=110.83 gb/GECG01012686.1/:1-2985(+)